MQEELSKPAQRPLVYPIAQSIQLEQFDSCEWEAFLGTSVKVYCQQCLWEPITI